MSAAAKTVLLVDDDTQFLEILQSLAQSANGEAWTVLAAETTALALQKLQTHQVDLLVVDLRMPVVDGVQFLQLIQNKYPHLKKIILSGHLDGSSRSAATKAGAELVLEKPVTPEGFQNVLAALGELLRWQHEEGFRGVLRRVGIEDVIQMECLNRASLVLEVSSPKVRGRIFLRKGELIHAECDGASGEEALQRLLSLTGGEFHHAPYIDPPARTLQGSWEFLVMEAMRKRDEAAGGVDGSEDASEDNEPEAAPPLPGISELVVCGQEGEILHWWQSNDAPQRAATLKSLSQTARWLGGLLPTGPLERIEIFGQPERVVARFNEQGAMFVRGTVGPE